MKKLGLIGGTGPESTLVYYREINRRLDELTEQKCMPEIVIESVDFRKAWRYVEKRENDLLGTYLADKARLLAEAGAEIIALTSVTMHSVYDDVCVKTHLPLVNMPKAVAKKAVEQGYKKVGLLGTLYTMEQNYMMNDLRNESVEVYVPDEDDRKLVARRILEELEVGVVKDSTRKEFQDIIRKVQSEHGIEAVVLGCTEIPLLLNQDNCPLPCLDCMDIHINELIRQAYECS